RELRPRYVVVENVAALLSRGLDVVLGDLAACGYDAEWDCIPAAAVGAYHVRDRIFIVAYTHGERNVRTATVESVLADRVLADACSYRLDERSMPLGIQAQAHITCSPYSRSYPAAAC